MVKLNSIVDKKLFTRIRCHNPLEAGQTGVGVVTNAEVRFDDVEITGVRTSDDGGPGNTTLSVKPQAKLTTMWGHLKSELTKGTHTKNENETDGWHRHYRYGVDGDDTRPRISPDC